MLLFIECMVTNKILIRDVSQYFPRGLDELLVVKTVVHYIIWR